MNAYLPTTENAQLVLVDVQGKLARLMHESDAMIGQIRRLIQAAHILELPVVWAEQLPDKLGPTVPELVEVLGSSRPLSKSSFGCCGDERLMSEIESTGRDHVLLCGIETHVCVWQTAVALRERGYQVHLIADAASSRSAFNRNIAWRRMEAIGVYLSNVEMVLFELMGDASHPRFRDVSRLLK
ncbi:MAG: hydrolase [Pseudomonadota bacterium]